MNASKTLALALCLFALPATALAGGPPKVDLCHWSNGQMTFSVLNLGGNALASHIANHNNGAGQSDHLAGVFYADSDGDGFGDSSVTAPCLNDGFVENDGDCDDADASVNPAAVEACSDGIDDDCDGDIDEGCATCPCFTALWVDQRVAEWSSTPWDLAQTTCDILDNGADNSVGMSFNGVNDNPFGHFSEQIYSVDSSRRGPYCAGTATEWNLSTSRYEQVSFFQYITEAEDDACQTILLDASDDAGLVCSVRN